MNKLSRTGFFAVALTLVLSVFTVSETSAQRTSEALKRMDTHFKSLKTLKAGVKMEKYNSQLKESDVYTGTIKYVPKIVNGKMYIRIDWEKPVEERMAVVGNEYVIYRVKQQQVYEGKTGNAKNNANASNALAFMSMSRKELVANFTHRDLGTETVAGGTQTVHLELTPKTAAGYKQAHLWVDKDGMPVMVRIVEKNNDTTTLFLSNLKKNEKLDGRDFTIDYPKSIKPIR